MTQHDFDGSPAPAWSVRPSGLALTLAVIFLSLTLCAVRADAQAVYGSIRGTILDQAGAAVPNAPVTITDTNKGTSNAATSDSIGAYSFRELTPDVYVIKVDAAGFANAVSSPITVVADSGVIFDFKLQLGASTQTIQVTAQTPQLKLDRADVATELNTIAVQNTPNLQRNATNLVLLAPGTMATSFSNASAEDPMRSTEISANGQTPLSAGFVLDGANNKDSFIGEIVVNPPLDAISEVKFVNQNYDAEFGAAVAGITVITTKSGTNSFHGDVFDFRRSDATQARDPFTQFPHNNPNGPDVPHTLSNIFGGSIGGPVLKNKLFFFADYQGTRQKIGNSFFMTIPTAKVHSTCGVAGATNCDLSDYLSVTQLYDPLTSTVPGTATVADSGIGRKPFAGNLIPNSRLSAPAVALLQLIPTPPIAGVVNNYVASGFGVYNFNQYDTRIDYHLKGNLNVFGRYGYLGSNQGSPAALGKVGGSGFGSGSSSNGLFAGSEKGGNHSLAVGADLLVRPNLFTDFRFSYFRYAFVEAQFNGNTPLESNLGIVGLNGVGILSGGASEFKLAETSGVSVAFNYLGSGNGGANHCNCPLNMTEQEFGFVNNWTRESGHHSLKIGAEVRIVHELRIPSDTNRTGEITFQGQRTGLGTGGGAATGGLSLATLLLGQVSTFSRYYSTPTSNPSAETQPRTFLYIQDNWRVNHKLTLNLGGRWEIYRPEHVNGKDQGGFWNSETDMIEIAGEGPFNNSLNIRTNWAFLAPRLGFAYAITGNSVIRGGLARAYDPGFFGDDFGAELSQNVPVLQTQSETPLNNWTTDGARNRDGSIYNLAVGPSAPVPTVIPASGEFVLPQGQSISSTRPLKTHLTDVFGWNVSYQRQINSTTALTAAYVASKSSHTLTGTTFAAVNFNDPPIYGYENGGTTCNNSPFYLKFGTLYPGVTNCGPSLNYFLHEANAHYSSFQVVLEKRTSKGLYLNGSYVLSSATGVTASGYFVQDPHAQWGRFAFNRKNAFKVNGGYELPFGKGKAFGAGSSPIVDGFIGGFSLNTNLNWDSGLPFGISYSACRVDAPSSAMPCRPNQVGSFPLGGKYNATAHYVQFFTPVSPLTANGQISGGFQRPAQYTFGSVENNYNFGPNLFTTDATLRKTIPIHETINMSIEVMAQNLFNHANFANPASTTIDAAGSNGRIVDIVGGTFAGMRYLQFAAHINY